MNTPSRLTALILLLTALGAFLPQTSQAELGDPDGMTMIADGLVARPAGAAVTVVGAAAYLVTLPFSAASGSSEEAFRTLVGKPAWFTFRRRLGDFHSEY